MSWQTSYNGLDFDTTRKDVIGRALLAAIILAQLPWPARAQAKEAHPPVMDLPQGAISRIPAPDGKWILIFECPNNCSERKLWIKQRGTPGRKLVSEYDRSLSISWAPDSRHFFVNDAHASNEARRYIIDPVTLKITDLAKVIEAGDTGVQQFLNAGHSYLKVKRSVNSHEVLVALYGHFDDPPPRGFTLQYRIGLNAVVRKVYSASGG